MNSRQILFALAALLLIFPLGCGLRSTGSESPEPITIIKPVPNDAEFNFTPRSTALYAGLQQNTYSKTGWDSLADISLDGRYMVFVSTSQAGNPDIYIKTISGTAMSQKTTSNANDLQPAISPDGKYIAFTSDRNGNYDIFITSAWSNGPLWQVTSSGGDEMSPSWSHDGTKLAYCAKAQNGEWELWTLDLSTQTRTNLGPGMNPKWHPSADILAFQQPFKKDTLSCSICTIDADGRNLNVVVRGDRWAAVQPAWSPDGTRIAFSAATTALKTIDPTTKGNDIFVVNLDGFQEVRVTENNGSNWAPAWGVCNGEERIYFTSDRDNRVNIWSVRSVRFSTAPVMEPTR